MTPEEIELITERVAERVADKLRGDRLTLEGPDFSTSDMCRLTGLHVNTMARVYSDFEYRPIKGGRDRRFRREEVLFARRHGGEFLIPR